MELEREWVRKLRAKDVDWIVDLFAEDGRQFAPGIEPVVGKEGLRTAWETMANTDGLELSWEPTAVHVSASGEMAYDYGTATIKTPDGLVQPAKYVVVWTRRDGTWRVAMDMFNASGPAAE